MTRQAVSRLKINPTLGQMPVLQYCAPAQLLIDPAYQRSLEQAASQTLVRKIAMFWNWDLCQPLVVARRDDGNLYVVDGQHRLAAAQMRGDITALPCVVTAYASAADEAASFVALNQQRRPLSALDLFKAAVAAEDETALAITKMMGECGLSIAAHQNCIAWKPGQVSNIGGIQKAYNAQGPGITRAAMMILSKAFEGQILQYAGTIFPGIVWLLSKDRTVSHQAMIDVLGSKGQLRWRDAVMRHRANEPNDKFQIAAGKVIAEALGQRLGVAPKPAPAPQRVEGFAKPTPAPAVIYPDKQWCQQCDRQVSGTFVLACQSKFCSVKRSTA